MRRVSTIADTVPQPCRVAGTILKPFCLGHHLLFKQLDIPLAFSAKAPAGRSEHILPAIAICAGQSYEWTLGRMLNEDWEADFKGWVAKAGRIDDDTEATFRAYLTDGYMRPPCWKDAPGVGISFSAPWEQILKCRLVESGFSESEVLNGYLPGRWYDYYTLVEFRQMAQLMRLAASGVPGFSVETKWKKIFYTAEDDAALNPPAPAQEEKP